MSRGYARATEGKQYKYYKINLASTSYSSPNNITKKPNEISSNICWLRSPIYRIVERFCYIAKNGSCAGADASMSLGIAPGFSI